MNKSSINILCILLLTCIVICARAQSVVIFTDANFKAAVVANPEINKNGDGEIQVSEAVAYKKILNVSAKNISNLQGIEAFTEITGLYCNNNNLSSLNISANSKLTILRCNHNNLTALDVTHNTALKDLRCYVNSIASLDLGANAQLQILWCHSNQLNELVLSSNTHLRELQCGSNPFAVMDVSNNHELTYFDVKGSSVSTLNIKNGNNTQITYFDALNNHSLLCIQVDDPDYSRTNWRNVDYGVDYSTNCGSVNTDIVYIPDPYFKRFLLSTAANMNRDGEIQVAEANSYGGHFSINRWDSITNLTGLEAFSHLYAFSIFDNAITSIDISKNTGLRSFKVSGCPVTTVDMRTNINLETVHCINNPSLKTLLVGENTNIVVLWCYANDLLSLDVSGSHKIRELECHHNSKMTSLTLGSQPELSVLQCFANDLRTLDVTAAPALQYLRCNLNKLTSLDLHANSNLQSLLCHDNLLGSLDLTMNTNLVDFKCTKNNLVSLDLHNNTSLRSLECNTNRLTSLNVKNGNNNNMTSFSAIENPNLRCIEVDDPVYSTANWRNVDAQVSFSRDCSVTPSNIVFIPDRNFKIPLVTNPAINTNNDGEIQVSEAQSFTGKIEVPDRNIASLQGIEAFTRITQLWCHNNVIYGLDVSHNKDLTYLVCYQNELYTLDVHANTKLEVLSFAHNHISSMDVTASPNLIGLGCEFNQLHTLNVSSNPLLTELICNNNQLTTVDLSSNAELFALNFNNNKISNLDFSHNPKLMNVEVHGNLLTSLDVSYCTNMDVLGVRNNRLRSLTMRNINMFNFNSFASNGNPELHCIEVDNDAYADYMNSRSSERDPWTSFSDNCSTVTTAVVSAYPNPTRGKITLQSEQSVGEVQVFDMMSGGLKTIQHGNEIDLSNLKSGIYRMSINQNGKLSSVRVIKE